MPILGQKNNEFYGRKNMKKNGKKNIVINAKSEKFFLFFWGKEWYNVFETRQQKAFTPYYETKKSFVFAKRVFFVEKGVLLKQGG